VYERETVWLPDALRNRIANKAPAITDTTLLTFVLRLLARKLSYGNLAEELTPANNRHVDAS